jgi:hypothetical protein
MRYDQQDRRGKGDQTDEDAAAHDDSPGMMMVSRTHATGMIGTAALTAIAAKNSAPTNERAIR